MARKDIKKILNKLYHEYNTKACLCFDPLFFVNQFKRKEDLEITGIVASSLAYGNVHQIKKNVQKVLHMIGRSPYEFVTAFHPVGWKDYFGDFRYRFNEGLDLANLIFFMKQMIDISGSIENFFMNDYSSQRGIGNAIDSFSKRALSLPRVEDIVNRTGRPNWKRGYGGVEFFFSSPSNGSACKRINLFLRWMVRKDNLDLGIWKDIDKSMLIIPLDIHIASISKSLGWTKRKHPSWKMAVEVTEALKKFDPFDPVKYDFALCHNGMQGKENRLCC